MNKKPLVLAISLALTALATQPAQAVDVLWTGTDGWWNDGANWNSGLQPKNGDNAYFFLADTLNRTVYYSNHAYPSAVLNALYLGAFGSGTTTFSQTTDQLSAYSEFVNNATFIQSGGTNTVLGSLSILANGTYNLSDTGSLSAVGVSVGESSTGTFTHSGGTNTVSGTLTLGLNSGSSGTYNLSNTGNLSASHVTVGNYGTGAFTQIGGMHTVSNNLILGYNSGSSGTYTLSAGNLSAGVEVIGLFGAGIFNQSGGTNTVSQLVLAAGSGSSGSYNLDGGTLIAGSIGGAGTLILNGGTLSAGGGNDSINVGNLVLGKASGSNVSYTLSTGGLYDGANIFANALTTSNLTLGDSGAGTFTQISGTNTVSGTLTLGLNSGSSGTYNLDGGILNVGTVVRGAGISTFNWTAGTINYGGDLIIGSSGLFGQTVTLDANKNISAGNLTIDADGTFSHASGAHTISHQMKINGISNLDGGTLNVGFVEGTGTLNLSGGALSVDGGKGTINVGNLVLGKASGSNVSYTLTTTGFYSGVNKVAKALAVSNLTLGDSGSSTFKMVGSSIFGVDTLTQNATSSLSGFGIISADNISNAGTINAKSGNLVLAGNSFSNTGLLKNSVGSNLFIEAATINHQGNIEVNSAGAVVFDAAISNVSGKTVQLNGGTLATPMLTNTAGGSVRGFGALSGNLTNAGSVEFYGPTNIVGDVLNQSSGTILVRNNQTLITGHTVNDGTIQTLQGTVIFEGGLTNNGAYLSDPSDNYFTDLTVGQTGYLVGELGDNFLVSGNFVNNSTQNTLWNTSAASLTLTGLALQNMYLAGDDLGALASGYNSNYAWGEFSLVLGASVKLWDGNGDPGAALYVGLVELGGGLGQLSSIDSPYNIYYDASLLGNAYLSGQTYALNGGGSLMAAQPVPEASTYAMMLAGLGLVGVAARRRKANLAI